MDRDANSCIIYQAFILAYQHFCNIYQVYWYIYIGLIFQTHFAFAWRHKVDLRREKWAWERQCAREEVFFVSYFVFKHYTRSVYIHFALSRVIQKSFVSVAAKTFNIHISVCKEADFSWQFRFILHSKMSQALSACSSRRELFMDGIKL